VIGAVIGPSLRSEVTSRYPPPVTFPHNEEFVSFAADKP
jgi:hypothetical protein